jgi:ABC-type sugar transport system ATPase subunit
VLGLAGLVGAGRTEVAEAIFGLDPTASGRVWIQGVACSPRSPREAMRLGLGLVPEDRKRHGLVLSMGARENITLPFLRRFARAGWIRRNAERELAEGYRRRLRIRTPDMDTPALSLSGGNQQKLVIARWVASRCAALIVDEPTRGVDVGAKAEIHALIDELAREGVGIVLISSELPELVNLATRVLVLRHGRMTGELPRTQLTQDALIRLMAGIAA